MNMLGFMLPYTPLHHLLFYEGQGAMELEAIVDENTLSDEDDALAYPFSISNQHENGLPLVDPLPMW